MAPGLDFWGGEAARTFGRRRATVWAIFWVQYGGVPHGVTSSSRCPRGLAWNEPGNGERADTVSAKLGAPDQRCL